MARVVTLTRGPDDWRGEIDGESFQLCRKEVAAWFPETADCKYLEMHFQKSKPKRQSEAVCVEAVTLGVFSVDDISHNVYWRAYEALQALGGTLWVWFKYDPTPEYEHAEH